MGTSSARPHNLETFVSRSRAVDDVLRGRGRSLTSKYGDFIAGTSWGVLDMQSMLAGFGTYIDWNEVDAMWVARIAHAFRMAGGDGALATLPDAAIHASLKAAGLLGDRESVTFDSPVAYGFPPTSGYANDPVNTASGNFAEAETDLPFAGLVSGLRFARTYNSRSDVAGAFGRGWSSWADVRLHPVPEGLAYSGPDGQRALFPREGSGYGRVLGIDARAETLPTGVALQWLHGERWEFDEAGLPVLATRGPGTDVRMRHDDGRLVALRHAGGSGTRLDWDGERVSGVVATDGRRVSYRYDDAGNVVAAGDRSYEVDDGGRVVSVLDADGVAEVANSYDDEGRVLAQVSPFGRRTLFGYLPGAVTVTTDEQGGPDNVYVHDAAGRLQAIVDGEGAEVAINYDQWGKPVAFTDRNGAVTIQEYDERSRLSRRVAPGGAEFAFEYDDLGRVVEVAERETAAVTRYGYDGDERTPSVVTDPEGGVARMTVEGGLVRAVTDPDGVRVEFHFDADGNIVAATDADGNVARMERDAAGLVTAAVTPLGRRTTFVHGDDGRVLERHNAAGAVWRYEYTAAGRPTALVDPTGAREEIRYDDHGLASATVDPGGHVLEHAYDVLGNVVRTSAADGATWSFDYDGVCRLTATTDPAGATWSRDFDADGNLVAATDPTGTRLGLAVDALGRLTGLDDGLTSASFESDALGRVVSASRPDGLEIRTDYDRCGRPLAVHDPAGGVTRLEYTAAGRVRRVIAPSGRVETRCEYDRCGRLAARTDGASRRREYAYDADNALVEAVAATGETERFEHDAAGRLVAWTAPGRGTTRYEHDPAGRIVAVADRTSGERRFEYDAGGRLVAATDANGATTSLRYDARGSLVEITDALGATTTRSFDAVGRIVGETDPLGRATTVAYDAAGRVVERTDSSGRSARWAYDAAGRVRSFGAAGEEPTTIEYDDLGRPVRIDEPGSFSHRLGYDRAGRLVERRRGALTVRWRYDEDGDRAALGHPDGSETRYGYDAGGLLSRLEHPGLGAIAIERDGAGRVTSARGEGLRATWGYDGGDLASYAIEVAGGRSETRLRRDPIGRVVEAIVDGAGADSQSDAAGQLVRAGERSFAYDAAGQLVRAGERTFEYDAGGRLVSERGPAGAIAYAYDAAGQLLERRFDAASGTTSDEYDAGGQLVERGADGVSTTSYEYDGAGRRVRETRADGGARVLQRDALGRLTAIEDGERTTRVEVDALGELATVDTRSSAGSQGTGATALMWDTADPLSPLVSLGAQAIVGPGSPWATATGGASDPLVPDWQGSLGGARDPWGAADAGGTAGPRGAAEVGVPPSPRLGYRGELEFEGLTWLRNRVYDAGTRAFLEPDPLPQVPGTACFANPYHYAANNPLGLADPLGLRPITDDELRDIRDRMDRNVFERGADWAVDNWEYVAAGAMVVAGVGLMCTGIGGAPGLALMMGGSGLLSAGASAGIQKLTTGEVNWREVGVQGAIGVGAGGLGFGAGALVAGTTRGAAVARGALAGGVESMGGGMANRGIHGANVFDLSSMGTDALLGAGGGGAGGAFAARRGTTLSGHGDWTPGDGHFVVPEGTTIRFYGTHGSTISDPLGNVIETRQLSRVPMTEVHGPGSRIPDYRLHPPDGLNIMDRPRSALEPLRYMGRSATVGDTKPLSGLLHPHMGDVDWAACRYVDGHPESNTMWTATPP